MYNKSLLFGYLIAAALTHSGSVFAGNIANGGFDSDLSQWSTVTNGGTVEWNAGSATLSTGSGSAAFSSVLVQGDDGTFSFATPILLGAGDDFLKFDAVFSSMGQDVLEDPIGSFTDNLQIWLYDTTNVSQALATLGINTIGSTFAIDLSPFQGMSVAFSFELNDEADGFDSRFTLDNVRIEPVPLPAAAWFELTALLGFAYRTFRKRVP